MYGVQFHILKIPKDILRAFEPSQIGTIIGTLMDACIPQLAQILPENGLLGKIGLTKHEGILGDREGYPDFKHVSGKRLELKLLYVDPIGVDMKKPPTLREASARITQKVTVKNVIPETDVLLVIAYQLQPNIDNQNLFSPTIIDIGLFSMIECVHARDNRLLSRDGKWFGNYETPAVLSKIGRARIKRGQSLNKKRYGRKESEGHDFNEDTNFGKLKRIPLESLQNFLKKHGATYARKGTYPKPWSITGASNGTDEEDD